MSITDSLNLVRQQLGTARGLAEQSGAAFAKLDEDTGVASSMISGFSSDVYNAGSDDENTDSAPLGANALRGLGAVAGQQGTVRSDLAGLRALEPRLEAALKAAMAAARSLAVRDVDRWFVTNAIDSAQRESGEASQNSGEIASLLGEADNELASARGSASAVARDGDGVDVSFEGDRLYQSVDDLDDSLRDAGLSGGHGAQHQRQVTYFIDQAMGALDDLERDYGGDAATAPPAALAPASSAFETGPQPGQWPAQQSSRSLPQSNSTVEPEPSSQEGFFTRPWQG